MQGFQPQHSRDPDWNLSVGGHVDAALDGQNQDVELILWDGGTRQGKASSGTKRFYLDEDYCARLKSRMLKKKKKLLKIYLICTFRKKNSFANNSVSFHFPTHQAGEARKVLGRQSAGSHFLRRQTVRAVSLWRRNTEMKGSAGRLQRRCVIPPTHRRTPTHLVDGEVGYEKETVAILWHFWDFDVQLQISHREVAQVLDLRRNNVCPRSVLLSLHASWKMIMFAFYLKGEVERGADNSWLLQRQVWFDVISRRIRVPFEENERRNKYEENLGRTELVSS